MPIKETEKASDGVLKENTLFWYFCITEVHISFQNCEENNEKCYVKNTIFKFHFPLMC